ncbi:MAG: hypothetical protein AAF310_01645 [Myxococcota bacterium]
MLQSFVQGLAYLQQDRYILTLIVARILMNIGAGLQVLYMGMAEEVLQLGHYGLGLFAALRGVGFFFGSFMAIKVNSMSSKRCHLLLVLAVLSMGGGFVALGLSGMHRWVWLSGLAIVWTFAGAACVTTVSITLIHHAGRHEFLGRVLAVDKGFGALAQMTTSLLVGWFLGPQTVVGVALICGSMLIVAAALWRRFTAAYWV